MFTGDLLRLLWAWIVSLDVVILVAIPPVNCNIPGSDDLWPMRLLSADYLDVNKHDPVNDLLEDDGNGDAGEASDSGPSR